MAPVLSFPCMMPGALSALFRSAMQYLTVKCKQRVWDHQHLRNKEKAREAQINLTY